MNNNIQMSIFAENAEYYDQEFSNLKYPALILEGKLFENCKFENVNFSEAQLIHCKFIDCEFSNCNLSAAQFKFSSLNHVIFFESKVTGINWTMLNWPHIRLASPFKFYKSIISHSSFYELELAELVIEDCVAHHVDFRCADLRHANLKNTDFENSQFMHTKLCNADFTEAYNYAIDPMQNDIKKAKFSLPDAIHLLDGLGIEIV